MTLIGALSFGELAAAMPHAGGQYVYLRESCGPVFGFLYGWTMLLVIQTATIAAVAIAFAKFSAVIVPWFSASALDLEDRHVRALASVVRALGPYNVGLNRQNLLAILSIVLLTWVNTRGLRLGKIVQNVFTVAKTISLAGLVLLGVLFSTAIARQRELHRFLAQCRLVHDASVSARQSDLDDRHAHAGRRGHGRFALLHGRVEQHHIHCGRSEKSRAQSAAFAGAWAPAIVILLYTLANVAYLRVLPISGDPHGATAVARGIEFAADGRVATAVAEVIFGPAGAIVMAIAILVSTFGCNNGLILSGRADLLRHGQGRSVLPLGRHA